MAKWIDIDSHVLAYWGFDEANETDPALDETPAARTVLIFNSPAVIPARANNGRRFDGASTYGAPADSSPFRLAGDLTVIAWVILDQINTSGSMLRTVYECAGSTVAEEDNCLFGLYFSSTGEIVYRHDHVSQVVVLKTAPNTVRIGRYYSIVIRRSSTKVELYLDNAPLAWASVTVDGASQSVSDPLPLPTGGTSATLYFGKSSKYPDAWWSGTIDETSIHDVARKYQPYLRGAYYRLTLSSVFFRLTVFNNVKSVGSTEMGGGSRWWVYERDNSLYCIRENTLGLFSPEVPLTMGGLQPNGVVAPGGTERPTLMYDKVNDLLVVAFIAAGKIFRLTAGVGDAPQTQAMPYTVDTAGIIKVRDSNDTATLGQGADGGDRWRAAGFVNRQPIKFPAGDASPLGQGAANQTWEKLTWGFSGSAVDGSSPLVSSGIQFTAWDSFGILIPWLNSYGYAVYSYQTGTEVLLGYVTARHTDALARSVGFWPLPTRVSGTWYYVKPLDRSGRPMLGTSNWICDLLGYPDYPFYTDRLAGKVVFNRSGDAPELVPLGQGANSMGPRPTYVNRQPVKLAAAGDCTFGQGAGLRLSVSCTTTPTAPQRKSVEAS